MSDLTLVGDELRLDGETVAVLVPGLRASLRHELENSFGRHDSAVTPRDLHERNEATIAQLKAERLRRPVEVAQPDFLHVA